MRFCAVFCNFFCTVLQRLPPVIESTFASAKIKTLVLTYTVTNEEIRLEEKRNGHGHMSQYQYPGPLQVGVKKACTHDLSVMSIEGKILAETDISYRPTEEIGVVACIQQVENAGCMVFNSDQNFALNCSPKIIDVLFIQSHLPFTFKYADRSEIKRVDIFLTQKEAEKLLNGSLLNQLDEHDMLTVKAENKNKVVEELLGVIGKKIQSEHLCKYLHELIIYINEIGKWKSRF